MDERVSDETCTRNTPPDIDDAVSTFEKPLSLVSEVILYALGCRDKCLVNVNTLLYKKSENAGRGLIRDTTYHWGAERSFGRHFVFSRAPPDGVIKDEDSLSTGMLFENLLDLCIVSRLDLVLVDKVFLCAGIVDELEPAGVEAQCIALSSGVMSDYRANVLADVGPRNACGGLVDIVIRGLGVEGFIVVEGGLDVTGSEHLDGHCVGWWVPCDGSPAYL